MPLYNYTAKNNSGKTISGKLQSENLDVAADQLLRGGMTPINIKIVKETEGVEQFFKKFGSNQKITLNHLIIFSRQMHTLMRAGVPITRAIRGLSESINHKTLSYVLSDIAAGLDSGHELSAAMKKHSKYFPPVVISIVSVGENTGRLDEAFERIATYLEFEISTGKQLKAATRYPMMVIIAIIVAVGVINIMVIPAFSKVFASLGADLPWQTVLLMNISAFSVAYWPYMLGCTIIGVFALGYFVKTPAGHYLWDRHKLRLPLIGIILTRISLSRFSRSFAMASKSGVPLIQTLTITSEAVGNLYIKKHILNMRFTIESGEPLTVAARKTGLFTPLVLQMMAVGDETGEIDRLLEEVSNFYEREVSYDIKRLTDMIEPILLIIMGALILIVALGVFLPMWDLGKAFNPK